MNVANGFTYFLQDFKLQGSKLRCGGSHFLGGVYDSATMTTLRNVLLTQYADFDFDDPELTQDTLKAIRNWYDNSSEIGKKGTYIWENGWGNIISGVLLMGAGYINGPVETPRASEEAKYGDQLEVSDQKMHQQGQHYNRHGRGK